MARRKQEPASVHRSHMIDGAKQLFEKKGIEKTTMDEIAAAAGYSKATLYVYFENKEEIVAGMILEGMTELSGRLREAANSDRDVIERYYDICHALLKYQNEYPMQFDLILQKIRIDVDQEGTPPIFAEIFEIGERMNQIIGKILEEGIVDGRFDGEMKVPQTIFFLWSGLSGIIQMAEQKKEYIETVLGCSQKEFSDYGFEFMLRSILVKGGSDGR